MSDDDELRLLALFAELVKKRSNYARLAGKSTLSGPERAPLRPDDRFAKIGHHSAT